MLGQKGVVEMYHAQPGAKRKERNSHASDQAIRAPITTATPATVHFAALTAPAALSTPLSVAACALELALGVSLANKGAKLVLPLTSAVAVGAVSMSIKASLVGATLAVSTSRAPVAFAVAVVMVVLRTLMLEATMVDSTILASAVVVVADLEDLVEVEPELTASGHMIVRRPPSRVRRKSESTPVNASAQALWIDDAADLTDATQVLLQVLPELVQPSRVAV
jgi:hypothetical protein